MRAKSGGPFPAGRKLEFPQSLEDLCRDIEQSLSSQLRTRPVQDADMLE